MYWWSLLGSTWIRANIRHSISGIRNTYQHECWTNHYWKTLRHRILWAWNSITRISHCRNPIINWVFKSRKPIQWDFGFKRIFNDEWLRNPNNSSIVRFPLNLQGRIQTSLPIPRKSSGIKKWSSKDASKISDSLSDSFKGKGRYSAKNHFSFILGYNNVWDRANPPPTNCRIHSFSLRNDSWKCFFWRDQSSILSFKRIVQT